MTLTKIASAIPLSRCIQHIILCIFKQNLFAWNRVTTLDNSKFAESIRRSGSFPDNKILVSSANSKNFNILETLQKSFRWRRKNKSPNREPCGIPQVIFWFHVEAEKSLNFLGDECDDLNASCKDTKQSAYRHVYLAYRRRLNYSRNKLMSPKIQLLFQCQALRNPWPEAKGVSYGNNGALCTYL